MKVLVAPLLPFISHPGRIAAMAILFSVAGLFLTIWQKKIVWGPFIAGSAWASFAAWEQHCVKMRYNIRVDLGVIYPLLAAFTIFGVIRMFVAAFPQTAMPRQFSTLSLLILTTVIAIALGGLVWFAQ